MPNPNGTPSSLLPAPLGNTRGLVHGAYSKDADRFLAPRVAEIKAELLALPHVLDIDEASAEEIARLRSLIERIDRALESGALENKRRAPRSLLEVRRRYSTELRAWHERFGLMPSARADWVGRATLAAEISRALQRDDD